MASKYDPLDRFFSDLDGGEHIWTFDDFEELTGVDLPPVATREATWWSNVTYWGKKWAAHGWYASPRISDGEIRFGRTPAKRGRPPASAAPGTAEEAPPRTWVPPGGSRIVLVGCVSSKADTARAAKDLYVSDLWAKRRAYAEATGLPWFILSAEHGLLHPDQVIVPYDVSLADASASESRAWSSRVAPQLIELVGAFGADTVEVHAGAAYTPGELRAALDGAGIILERPLEGLRIGEQLSWYSRMGTAVEASSPPRASQPSPGSDGTAPGIVEAMLAFVPAEDQAPPEIAVFVPDNMAANRFLNENPFAFLTAVIFDQGILAERAWEAPLLLRERLGHLEMERLAEDVDSIKAAVAAPPALHRYVNNVPEWVSLAAQKVLSDYGGDAGAIWSDRPTADQLQRRLEDFQGIGPKKGAMAVEILIRQFGVPVQELSGTNLAYDVHVRRVFLRTGLAQVDDQGHMLEMARKHHPERPGALDLPAWLIGREWCGASVPSCGECVLDEVCPKLVARGDDVKGA